MMKRIFFGRARVLRKVPDENKIPRKPPRLPKWHWPRLPRVPRFPRENRDEPFRENEPVLVPIPIPVPVDPPAWKLGSPDFVYRCATEMERIVQKRGLQDVSETALQPQYRLVKSSTKDFAIENRVYAGRALRKAHLEIARRDDGLAVFHFVMFPDARYDLPVFSMDVVAFNGRVTMAICDVCPVSDDMSLPHRLVHVLKNLRRGFGIKRKPPIWGQEVFSDLCVIIQPENDEDIEKFYLYARSALSAVLTIASNAPESKVPRLEVVRGLERYSRNMLQNDKTRVALARSFGKDWADRYMREVMFDTSHENKEN